MNRPRRWSVAACVALLVPLAGADDKKPQAPTEEKWLVDRALTVSPQAAPVPALRYRLFPVSSERKDGNAVPMYLRLAHERSDAAKRYLHEHVDQWNALPLDRLPLEEARKFVDGFAYNLKQLDLGARRKTAEWNYALDSGSVFDVLLPDIHDMRYQARLLQLKARVEVAQGRYDDAVRTLQTAFSFSRQLSEVPFFISSLVAVSTAAPLTEVLLEMAQRPDAPNLYWALATLPRPLIDLRAASEFEQRTAEMQFPDLADLDRPRTAEQWDAALARVRKEVERLTRMQHEDKNQPAPIAGTNSSDPAARSPDLAAAKKYLTDVTSRKSADVDAMPPAQVLLLWIYDAYQQSRDDVFKGAYLPFPQARPFMVEASRRHTEPPATEAARFARLWNPWIEKVLVTQIRLERMIAAVRVIEALRLHAAAHGGQLPEKLADVTAVPVPDDPGTGKPFEYQRNGDAAVLISRIPGVRLATDGLRYRISVRK
jgi:hypothetical protein